MNKMLLSVFNYMKKFVAYYDGNQTVSFSEHASAKGENLKPLVYVIARSQYQETLVESPITDKKELNSFLKLEYGNSSSYFQIVDSDDNKSYVNVWKFSNDIPNALFIIPETFLLKFGIKPNQIVSRESNKSALFVAQKNSGVISSYNTQLINSPEKFAESIGIKHGDTLTLSKPEYLKCLYSNVSGSLFNGFFTFIQSSFIAKKSLYRGLVYPSLAVLSAYLLLSSVWLKTNEVIIDNKFDAQKDQMLTSLELQNQTEKIKSAMRRFNNFYMQQSVKAPVWFVVKDIIADSKLTSLRFSAGRYKVIGRTEKATELMAKLTSNPLISDPRFEVPTRKGKKDEYFNISFQLVNNIDFSEVEG